MTIDVQTDGHGRALCWLVWRMEHDGRTTLCGVYTSADGVMGADASLARACRDEALIAKRCDGVARRFRLEQAVLNHEFGSTG